MHDLRHGEEHRHLDVHHDRRHQGALYESLADSIKDRATVLSTRPRYAKAMKLTDNPKAFLTAVAKAGWSGSSSYVSKVYALITKYGVTGYDLAITATLTKGATGAKVTALQNLLLEGRHERAGHRQLRHPHGDRGSGLPGHRHVAGDRNRRPAHPDPPHPRRARGRQGHPGDVCCRRW